MRENKTTKTSKRLPIKSTDPMKPVLSKSEETHTLQMKSENNDSMVDVVEIISTTMFDSSICEQLLNTIATFIGVFGSFEHSFSMSEIGTMILEHYFGHIRVGCRFDHTIEKIIQVINKLIVNDYLNWKSSSIEPTNKYRDSSFAQVPEGAIILNESECKLCKMMAIQLWALID